MTNNYRATVAAIRTVYGRRLRTADYRDLINLHAVPDVVSYLKETENYRELLRGLDPAFTHRGHLEMLLHRNLFTQCVHFCSLEQLHKIPFYRFFIYDSEVRELVKAIQLLPNAPQGYISAMDAWLAPYLDISLEALARATDAKSLLDAIAHTPYEPVLRKLLQPDGTLPYTQSEIALRVCMMERIQNDAKRALSREDMKALRNLIGEQIDLINLINAFRMKRIFHADDAALRPMLLPIAGKLPKHTCEALYAAPDAAQFIEILRGTRYGRMLPALSNAPEAFRIELAFQSLRYQTARKALHFSGNAAVNLYALHILQQTEVQNLIAIIEGIRYQKPVSYIQSLLILE